MEPETNGATTQPPAGGVFQEYCRHILPAGIVSPADCQVSGFIPQPSSASLIACLYGETDRLTVPDHSVTIRSEECVTCGASSGVEGRDFNGRKRGFVAALATGLSKVQGFGGKE